VDLDSFKKLETLKGGHLTKLGISVLIDDEAPPGLDMVLRDHIKRCASCRKQMTAFLRVERIARPER
jgi:hypothetical protein